MQGTKQTSPTLSVRPPRFCRECDRQLPKRSHHISCATCRKAQQAATAK